MPSVDQLLSQQYEISLNLVLRLLGNSYICIYTLILICVYTTNTQDRARYSVRD